MFQHGGNVQSSACQVFEKNMIFRDREAIAYSIALYSSPMKEKMSTIQKDRKYYCYVLWLVLIVVQMPYSVWSLTAIGGDTSQCKNSARERQTRNCWFILPSIPWSLTFLRAIWEVYASLTLTEGLYCYLLNSSSVPNTCLTELFLQPWEVFSLWRKDF